MQLDVIRKSALNDLAQCHDPSALDAFRVKYLGKKGALSEILKSMGSLEPEERKALGAQANTLKSELEALIEEARGSFAQKAEEKLLGQGIDVTWPGNRQQLGRIHPISQTAYDVLGILERMGFETVRGPEIEHDFYNFQALNIPEDHPAREMQDTFYVAPKVVLRTQTSPVQIRSMLALKEPPVRVACFGKVYRHDQDATHSPMFHQIEVLCVDKGISFATLKGTLTSLIKRLFDPEAKVRLRPSFFPFTEPSAEVDMSCFMCKGSGCRLCKQTGWIEILGCGLVHPSVLKTAGFDPEKYSGFALGMGVERVAMLRYGVSDIRDFYDNDLRFLRQF